jgi:DnaJ domain
MSYPVQIAPAVSLEALNEASQRSGTSRYILVIGIILGFFLIGVHFVISLLCWGLTTYIYSITKKADEEKGRVTAQFDIPPGFSARWSSLNQALDILAHSHRVWKINSSDPNYDWKRHGGASALLTRSNVRLGVTQLAMLVSNITPFCIDIFSHKIYFYPDRIYILSGKYWSAISYDSVTIEVGKTQYIESQGVSNDSVVVGQTWQYVNKNGGPDRRFNYNPQLPIVVYGVVDFRSPTMNFMLHTSNADCVEQFYNLYRAFKTAASDTRRSSSYESSSQSYRPEQKRTESKQRTQAPPKPKAPPVEKKGYYEVLGLIRSCTREEASAKYRYLVSQYHPDKVSHMAKEFQDLANQKLREINLAYEELKKEKDW